MKNEVLNSTEFPHAVENRKRYENDTEFAFFFYVETEWKAYYAPVISLRSVSMSAAKMGSLISFFFTHS